MGIYLTQFINGTGQALICIFELPMYLDFFKHEFAKTNTYISY